MGGVGNGLGGVVQLHHAHVVLRVDNRRNGNGGEHQNNGDGEQELCESEALAMLLATGHLSAPSFSPLGMPSIDVLKVHLNILHTGG